MTEETLAGVEAAIGEAVQPILRQFRRHVTREDLTQECWLWVYEHMGTVNRLLAEGRPAALRFRLRRVAERYARKEKAQRSGYAHEDEVFYSVRVISELLPDALDPTATPARDVQDDRVSASREGYGEWEAALADVRRALGALSQSDRDLLVRHQAQGKTADELAAELGVTADAVYGRLGRIMRRLQRALGGSNPWRGGD